MTDRYRTFTELAAAEREGDGFRTKAIDRASQIAVVAPHGGAIEPGTSRIAQALAGPNSSLYLFEALKPGRHRDYHVASHRFDDPIALDLLSRAEIAVAIHGRRDTDSPAIWLGGLAIELRDAICCSLTEHDFLAVTSSKLPGRNPMNICNRAKSGLGVQLEIPRSLRNEFVANENTLAQFCDAIRAPLDSILG